MEPRQASEREKSTTVPERRALLDPQTLGVSTCLSGPSHRTPSGLRALSLSAPAGSLISCDQHSC